MPNTFFYAKSLWESGQPRDAVVLLNQFLKQQIGQEAFVSDERLYIEGAFPRFELVIFAMCIDDLILRSPFGQVFTQIWELHPHHTWITLLANYDFYKIEEDLELLGTEIVAEYHGNLSQDFRLITDTLVASAVKGVLGATRDTEGIRAVLSLDEIALVPDATWGELKTMLQSELTSAYTACPPDFWKQWSVDEPIELFLFALHDLFLEHGPLLSMVERRWKVLTMFQEVYINSVRAALNFVLSQPLDPMWLVEVAHVDAGCIEVTDGIGWLQGLKVALIQQDFSLLAAVSKLS